MFKYLCAKKLSVLISICFTVFFSHAQTLQVNLPGALQSNHDQKSLRSADVDNDGNMDIITATAEGLYILWGKGDGKTNEPMLIKSGFTSEVIVGIYDNDNKPDLATSNGNDSISIFINKGNRSFAAPVNYYIGHNALGMATTDFTNDGLLDLVTAGGSGYISILINQGNSFSVTNIKVDDDSSMGHSVQTGDFNEDYKEDIVIARSENTVLFLAGNGDGTFADPVGTYIADASPISIVVADFDHDTHLDIATSNAVYGAEAVAVMYGAGDGTFDYPEYQYTDSDYCTDITTGDFNGDTFTDLAIADMNLGNVSVFINDAAGSFMQAVHYTAFNTATYITSTDMDNDGKTDLLAGHLNQDYIAFLKGKGNGQFVAPVNYFTYSNPTWTEAEDFNADGKLDIAVACNSDDRVTIFLNNGDNTFSPSSKIVDFFPFSMATLDVNDDHVPDIAVKTTDGVTILENYGDGTFKFPDEHNFSEMDPGAIRAADLNGDNRKDLVTVNGRFQPGISVLFNKSTGLEFHTTITFPNVLQGLNLADYNKDSKIDLAVTSYDSLFILEGDGVGNFSITKKYETNDMTIALGLDIKSYDLNNDNNLDLILAGDSTMTIMEGDGTGAFSPFSTYDIGHLVHDYDKAGNYISIKDINNDGNVDISIACLDGMAFFMGKGDGTFLPAKNFLLLSPTSVSIADLNGDGSNKIIVTNDATGLTIIDTNEGASCDLPAKPSLISGDVNICKDAGAITYAVAAIPSVSTFKWTVVPDAAGQTSNVSGNTAQVNWSPNFSGTAELHIQSSSSCGDSEVTIVQITSAVCTGIATEESLKTKIYPNPSNGTFIIDTDPANVGSTYEILNSTGQIVKTGKINENTMQVDLGNVNDGLYLIRIKKANTNFTQRIVVN